MFISQQYFDCLYLNSVVVEFPVGYPRIALHPKLKSVEKGLSTVMQCEASGDPTPTITWLKDMMPVDTSDPRIQIMDNGKYPFFFSGLLSCFG
jgi:hypothetical protein